MGRISISVLVIAVVAFLIYRHYSKKKEKQNKATAPVIVNFSNPVTGSRVVSGDLTNGLNADVAMVAPLYTTQHSIDGWIAPADSSAYGISATHLVKQG